MLCYILIYFLLNMKRKYLTSISSKNPDPEISIFMLFLKTFMFPYPGSKHLHGSFILPDSKAVKFWHISVTFLLITFFGAFFQNFFNGFEISVKFSVFWHLFWYFLKKKCLGHICTFFKLWLQMRRKRLKKRKIFFY